MQNGSDADPELPWWSQGRDCFLMECLQNGSDADGSELPVQCKLASQEGFLWHILVVFASVQSITGGTLAGIDHL